MQESTIFEDQGNGIRITSEQVSFPEHSFPISSITSARRVRHRHDLLAMSFCLIGGALLVVGIFLLLVAVTVPLAGDERITGAGCSILLLALPGRFLLVRGLAMATKPTYAIRIISDGRRSSVLASSDEALIDTTLGALHEALAAGEP